MSIEERVPASGSASEVAPPPEAPAAAQTPVGQVRRNLVFRVMGLGVTLLLGLWFPPYLVEKLGLALYGLVPLVNQLASYATILNTAFSTSTGRFITIDVSRGDAEGASRTLSTAVFGGLVVVVAIMAPLSALIIWVTPHVIEVPAGAERALLWLQVAAMCAFMLNFLNNFHPVLFALNRLDVSSGIDALAAIARVAMVVALFSLLGVELWYVGLGLCAASVISMAGYVTGWRRLAPQVRLNWRAFSLPRLKELMATGGWVSINALGSLLYLNVDLILVNRLAGPEQGGAYGAILQWSVVLRTVGFLVAGVLDPILIARHAQDDQAGMMRLVRTATKFAGLLVALPVGIICGLSKPLLTTWLGPEFAIYWKLLWLLTLHQVVNLAVRPMLTVNVARNELTWPALATIIIGLGNVGMALLLGGTLGWGIYGVAAAGMIAMTLRNGLFQTIYTIFTTRVKPLFFCGALLWPLVAAVALALGLHVLGMRYDFGGWLRLAGVGVGAAVVYAAVVLGLLLNRDERRMLWELAGARRAAKAAGS